MNIFQKDKPETRRKYLQSIFVNGLVFSIIKKSQNLIIKQTKQLKIAKDLNRHFTKEYIWMVSKHGKRCSTVSLMHIKTQ